MALTFANLTRDVSSKRLHRGTITFDSSYPTGGESLTPSEVNLHTIERISFEPVAFTVDTLVVTLVADYDYTNKKVRVFEQGVRSSGTAAADTVNFVFLQDVAGADSAVKLGGPAVAINTNYSFGGLKEVGSTVDLSAVTFRYEAVGT